MLFCDESSGYVNSNESEILNIMTGPVLISYLNPDSYSNGEKGMTSLLHSDCVSSTCFEISKESSEYLVKMTRNNEKKWWFENFKERRTKEILTGVLYFAFMVFVSIRVFCISD